MHLINGSIIGSPNGQIIDETKPVNFFGTDFKVTGLTFCQPDESGKICPVSIDCNEDQCKSDNGLSWFLPDDCKAGILFFESLPIGEVTKDIKRNRIICREGLRMIAWLDKCKLGYKENQFVFHDVAPYIMKTVVCQSLKNTFIDSGNFLQNCGGNVEPAKIQLHGISLRGKPQLNNRLTFAKYTGINSTYLGTTPYEYFHFDFVIEYDLCLADIEKPTFANVGECECYC